MRHLHLDPRRPPLRLQFAKTNFTVFEAVKFTIADPLNVYTSLASLAAPVLISEIANACPALEFTFIVPVVIAAVSPATFRFPINR